ncbi:aspartate/glutamate racemase family protein [Sphingosinicella sp. LHD-64]|uniref:maleate cis-trans isomerase family protein n=1 Tax=Sphingosinicella sp. LHD-64 TaxID=3072139 RepID=UPI00280D8797|nr:aspartate/glutamate racemase family protein [Sphingosinicella sp. LHD-64]MDQ8756564.1 aspartate/glutamate racemase family protein [Sphingosinicella sp. LHD-64]
MSGYDYGRAGTLGIGTPQANPTVEAEMRILLPPPVAMAVVRLTSTSQNPLFRLRLYLEGLEETLAQYDALRPDAFGFACTGSSYLVGAQREAEIVAEVENRFGYPIVTATAAIAWQLERLGAQRIALVSPYPAALADAAEAYWRAAGFDVAEVRRIETGSADTRSIYALGSEDARPAAEALRRTGVDAVLLSGTGMPSLALIADAEDGPPVISSNLCLALRLCDLLGAPAPDPADWRPRLAQALTLPEGPR